VAEVRAGVSLALVVEPTSRRVLRASYCGAGGEVAGVLETFCALVEGLPLEEACSHGVHRAMAALRDPNLLAPIPGVVTPRNASPIFLELLEAGHALLGALDAAHLESVYRPPPSPRWQALSDDERLARVLDLLPRICVELGLEPSALPAPCLTMVTLAPSSTEPTDGRLKVLAIAAFIRNVCPNSRPVMA